MFKKLKEKLGLDKKSEAAEKAEVQRPARLQVDPLHNILFRVDGAGENDFVKIANISISGIGFYPSPLVNGSKPGAQIKGSIVFPTVRYPATCKVVHVSSSGIGCAFEGEYDNLKGEIEKYFAAEIAAVGLTQVRSDILKAEDDGTPRLWRGRNNCELFLVENTSKLVRFQLSYFGNYIEGGPGLRTKVGFLSPNEADRMKYKGSSLVRIVSELSPDILKGAVKFVEHVPDLDPGYRSLILSAIQAR